MSVSLNFLARSCKLDLKISSLAVTISHRLGQILLPNLSHRFWRNTLEGERSVINPEIFWVVWKFLRPLVVVDQLFIETREPDAQRCEQGGEAPEVVCIVSNIGPCRLGGAKFWVELDPLVCKSLLCLRSVDVPGPWSVLHEPAFSIP